MATKTAAKKKDQAPVPAPTGPSALETLLALSTNSPPPKGSATIVQSLSDPALQGATKKGSVVQLGLDPEFTPRAKHCADLNEALKNAETAFSVLQTELRDYGAEKRERYNDLFNADAITVCVPYEVDSPGQPNGKEKKFVQVICTNKYSVQQDVIKGSKEALGEHYDRLFEETTTRTLKPNAEELLRNLFLELKVPADRVDATLDSLRDVNVSVKTKADYEKQSKHVPEAVKTILDQGVKRQQPGLKFQG